MNVFNPDKLYRPSDPEMRQIGSYSKLAHWRQEGKGPPYIKYGISVFYLGQAINDWLAAHVVEPAAKE